MIDFIKFILKEYVKNKVIIITVVIIAIIALFKKYLPNEFKFFSQGLSKSKTIILNEWISLVCLGVLLIILFILFKISDKKYWEEWDRHYPRISCYFNENNKPVMPKISEQKEYEEGKLYIIRSISIENTSKSHIEQIKGKIDFYSGNTIVFSEEFNLSNIRPGTALEFCHERIEKDDRKRNWNRYNTNIFEMVSTDFKQEKTFLMGITKLPNYNLIIDRCYLGFSKHHLPYELTWFKKEIIHHTLSMIKFYFKYRGILSKLLVIMISSIFLTSIAFIFFKALFVVWQLIQTWYAFIHKLSAALFT